MIPTLPYLERRFGELNAQCFDGELPTVPIRLSRAHSYLGQLCFRKKLSFTGVKLSDFVLRISVAHDLQEDEVTDTLLHEMIHLYIAVKRLGDTSAHGPRFRAMMADLNRRFGRHISVSHRRTQAEMDADTRRRQHLLGVSTMADGSMGITLAARSRLSQLWDQLERASLVRQTTWYVTYDPYFNRYARVLTPKVYRIGAAELEEHLKGARPLVRQGGRIFVGSGR